MNDSGCIVVSSGGRAQMVTCSPTATVYMVRNTRFCLWLFSCQCVTVTHIQPSLAAEQKWSLHSAFLLLSLWLFHCKDPNSHMFKRKCTVCFFWVYVGCPSRPLHSQQSICKESWGGAFYPGCAAAWPTLLVALCWNLCCVPKRRQSDASSWKE